MKLKLSDMYLIVYSHKTIHLINSNFYKLNNKGRFLLMLSICLLVTINSVYLIENKNPNYNINYPIKEWLRSLTENSMGKYQI